MIQEKDEKTRQKARPAGLIVDDSAAIMDAYHFVLVQAGYRVATAPDGAVGLQLLRSSGRPSSSWTWGCQRWTGWSSWSFTQGSLDALAASHRQFRPRSVQAPALKLGAVTFLKKPSRRESSLPPSRWCLGRAPTADLLDRHAESLAKARQETIAARETLLAPWISPIRLPERLEALVVWITGFYGYGMASVDVLKAGKVHVVCAHGGNFPTGTVVARTCPSPPT